MTEPRKPSLILPVAVALLLAGCVGMIAATVNPPAVVAPESPDRWAGAELQEAASGVPVTRDEPEVFRKVDERMDLGSIELIDRLRMIHHGGPLSVDSEG